MRLIVTGKGLEVSDYLQNLVTKKASKLERYFKPQTEVYVTLSIEKSRHIAEVTVFFDGVILRCEESSGDMYGSIDAALKKLERKIRRHRTRLEKRLHEDVGELEPVFFDEEDEEAAEEDEYEAQIVRRKRFPIKPMDIEEAELQMNMLGHNFFVFQNAETGDVNVLYQRHDGDLGLIEPDIE